MAKVMKKQNFQNFLGKNNSEDEELLLCNATQLADEM